MRIAWLALLVACGGAKHQPTPPPEQAPKLAGIYSEDLDRSADPCTDIYEFANGTWRKNHPTPASMVRWSRRWEAGESSKDRLHNILTEVAAKTTNPNPIDQQLGDFYGACMDEAAVEAAGTKPIEPMLAKIAAIRDKAGLQPVIVDLHRLGIDAPFGFGAQSDVHDPTHVVGSISAGGLGLPDRDYYVKTEARFVEARAKYLDHVTKMFELIGSDERSAKANAQTVLVFETRLAMAQLDNVALRDPQSRDHQLEIAELQKLVPDLDWTAYLTALNVPAVALNVDQPAFMKELEHELAKTPVSEWRTYLQWQFVNQSVDALPKAFIDEDFEFSNKYLAGTPEPKPRWKRCVENTDRLLGDAVGQKYVEKYFSPQAKARMTELVHNLLAAMKDTIEQLDWMTPATKQHALEKLATFNPKIGYPDKWKNYAAIQVKRDTWFADLAAASAWNTNDERSQIGKPVDRGRWGITVSTSDAYYNAALNEIVFPAGILQPPAFRIEAADAVNYGAIGVVIGHEISHGFDDQGAKFDAQGKLENWWTPEDLAAFTKRGECVADQFEHYFIEPEIHHNGKLVLGESIGDLGGVNLAYRALEKTHPSGVIDGFTPEQQFFIAWGQFRGDAIRPEQQRLMVQGDPHPIAKYRVIGPFSNTPAFAEAFSCKPGSTMVRPADQQCKVW